MGKNAVRYSPKLYLLGSSRWELYRHVIAYVWKFHNSHLHIPHAWSHRRIICHRKHSLLCRPHVVFECFCLCGWKGFCLVFPRANILDFDNDINTIKTIFLNAELTQIILILTQWTVVLWNLELKTLICFLVSFKKSTATLLPIAIFLNAIETNELAKLSNVAYILLLFCFVLFCFCGDSYIGETKYKECAVHMQWL